MSAIGHISEWCVCWAIVKAGLEDAHVGDAVDVALEG